MKEYFRSFFSAMLLTSVVSLVACSNEIEEEHPKTLNFAITVGQGWEPFSSPHPTCSPQADSTILLSDGRGNIVGWMERQIMDAPSRSTRGTLKNSQTMYSTMSLTGFSYSRTESWNAQRLPTWKHNSPLLQSKGWEAEKGWPGLNKHVRFFLYAPYNAAGMTFSPPTQAGAPSFDFETSTNVVAQQDLLVGKTNELPGSSSPPIPLRFQHALTAVKISYETGLPGYINAVSIHGIYRRGHFDMESFQWSNPNTPTDFIHQNGNAHFVYTQGDNYLSKDQVFLMIPQTTPQGAKLIINYKDINGNNYPIEGTLKGEIWPQGQLVNYAITIPAENLTTYFEPISSKEMALSLIFSLPYLTKKSRPLFTKQSAYEDQFSPIVKCNM